MEFKHVSLALLAVFSIQGFSQESKASINGQTVELNGREIQIQNKAVYFRLIGAKDFAKIPGSDGHNDSLSVYDGKLFALDGSKRSVFAELFDERGTVYVFQDNSWVPIDYNDIQLLATKDTLVSLGRNGQLWIYKGKIEMPTSGTVVPTQTINPINGQVSIGVGVAGGSTPSSFFNSGIKNVVSINTVERDGEVADIEIHFKNGSVDYLSRIKATGVLGLLGK